jgi:hypothetical protein
MFNCHVRIDAHLQHGKQLWCYLVEVNVPESIKPARPRRRLVGDLLGLARGWLVLFSVV